MSELRQRFAMHMRLGKGGYRYAYEILDGDRVVGTKVVVAETRSSPQRVAYNLGDRTFDTVKDFIAAYEANEPEQRELALGAPA